MKPASPHTLLSQWLAEYRKGTDLAADDLCPDQPLLAEQLKPMLEQLRQMNGPVASLHEDAVPASTDEMATLLPAAALRSAVVPPGMTGEAPPLPPTDDTTVNVPLGQGDSPETVLPSGVPAQEGAKVPGYEIVGELGRGGMGVVYKARQEKLNRLVALKMILLGGHAGPEDRLRFLAEAEAIAAIQHPGIVQIHDFGTHQELPFFALEFCSGGSLAGKLNGTPLPPREAAHLVEQIAHAMQAAHERGIIHRDLKPGNILLSVGQAATLSRSEGQGGSLSYEPKVTDFGLARRVEGGSGLTQTGAIMGTPSYMAPEQAEGKKDVGPAADVYALGAILYECLTGRPPFRAATTFDTIMQVLADEPVTPRQLNARVPGDLEKVCLKCLRKEPDKRYGSARELAEDLARWQRGQPVLARPVGMSERAVKWARRRPAVAGLLAGIVLLTATALAVTTGLYRHAAWEAQRAQKAEKTAGEERDNAQEQEGAARKAETVARTAEAAARTAETAARNAEAAALKQEELTRQEKDKTKAEKDRAEEELTRAERLLYASQIQSAQREWEAGNVAMAWEHLDSCRWDYRNLEHRYLFTLFNQNHVTLKGHSGRVNTVAISSDGGRIVSGSADGTVKVWDARIGKDLLTLKGHSGRVNTVAISSDGGRIVSGSEDKTVKVWDARTGKDPLTLKGHSGGVNTVAISSDGGRIVSGSEDKTVKVWDARTGKDPLTLKGHSQRVYTVALSSDGGRIVSGSADGTVKVWDARTGKDPLTLKGRSGGVKCVALSGDGGRIVSGGADWTVKVWDARTGEELLTLKGHTYAVTSVALSSDGGRIVSGSEDNKVKVWDARTGKVLLTLKGHTGEVTSVAIGRDGGRIVSGSYDDTVKVWDAHTGSDPLTLKGHSAPVTSVAIRSDGGRIVSGGEWRGGQSTLKVWDARTGKELLTLKGHKYAVTSVALSSDGGRIVSGSQDNTVKVWDARTGRDYLTLKKHSYFIDRVAISSDGKRIVAQDNGGTILAWDSVSGKLLPSAPAGRHAGGKQASNPDGKFRVSIEDGSIRVYRADLEQARKERETRDRELLERLARFDPDWHREQLDEALAAGDDFAAAFHLDRLARTDPGDAALQILAAQAQARLGKGGDSAGGRQALTDLVRRLQQEKNPQGAAKLLVQALAGPWKKPEAASLVAAARRELNRERKASTLHLYGAALYRTGRYAEAALTLAEAVQAHGKGGSADTWLFQAMTARQQGKHEEAARLLARYEEWHGKQKFTAWQDRVMWSALLGEARKLIHTSPQMPKVAAGE